MQDHEKKILTLALIGAAIAIGKVLSSSEPLTLRLFIGRIILGAGVSMIAGAALVQFPDLSPVAINGIGAALGIAGYQGLSAGCASVGINLSRGTAAMTLSEKQQLFTILIAQLILWADGKGYRLTFGEAYRTPEQAAINAKKGSGISNSLHTKRLAVDLNLFINGQYQTDSAAYLPLGEYWESLGGSWGGRFKSRPDGNHFSLEHEGVR